MGCGSCGLFVNGYMWSQKWNLLSNTMITLDYVPCYSQQKPKGTPRVNDLNPKVTTKPIPLVTSIPVPGCRFDVARDVWPDLGQFWVGLAYLTNYTRRKYGTTFCSAMLWNALVESQLVEFCLPSRECPFFAPKQSSGAGPWRWILLGLTWLVAEW